MEEIWENSENYKEVGEKSTHNPAIQRQQLLII